MRETEEVQPVVRRLVIQRKQVESEVCLSPGEKVAGSERERRDGYTLCDWRERLPVCKYYQGAEHLSLHFKREAKDGG